VPRYADVSVLRQVATGDLEAPAVGPAVELSAAQLSTTVLDLLLNRPVIVAPLIWHVDVRERRASMFRPSRLRFQLSAFRASLGR
jgi:hypothetical protein